MKIDKATCEDIEERQNGITADNTSRPDKVLFFTERHFLLVNSYHPIYKSVSEKTRCMGQTLIKSKILAPKNPDNFYCKLIS